MKYEAPQPISKEAVAAALASGDVERACKALVDAAFHLSDWEWVQERCLELTHSPETWLRKVACTCLGHVARIHRKLDLRRVMPRLTQLLNEDPEPLVRGSADDAIDGIVQVWKPEQVPT